MIHWFTGGGRGLVPWLSVVGGVCLCFSGYSSFITTNTRAGLLSFACLISSGLHHTAALSLSLSLSLFYITDTLQTKHNNLHLISRIFIKHQTFTSQTHTFIYHADQLTASTLIKKIIIITRQRFWKFRTMLEGDPIFIYIIFSPPKYYSYQTCK